ncbi:MAG TPA: YHS domain-containing protein [Thermoanaerobaculia bacterium]|jgi:YHS domain-containing protein|nr:YHS domain-containing protein [Thermoanaerobaculia bacterium]
MAIDPVCGMEVDEEDAEATARYSGRTYVFCSDACKEEFEDDPEQFAPDAADAD